MAQIPRTIALVPGAENGIGPELLLRAVNSLKINEPLQFLWCGDRLSLELAANQANLSLSFEKMQVRLNDKLISFLNDMTGTVLSRQAMFLDQCVKRAKEGQVDALVTGPIDKAALRFLDEGDYVGQTEFFARHLAREGSKQFMAFMGGPFFLSLLTTHVPLACVASSLDEKLVTDHLMAVAENCARIYQKPLSKVRIVVLGINPHAGENGLLGNEEKTIITPAITSAQKRGLTIEGPLSADGFFAFFHRFSTETMPDAIVATYHDQGLIPYKLLAQGTAVNVTFGLRIVRTSPAHGTAYDLFKTGRACPKSTEMALKLAINLKM